MTYISRYGRQILVAAAFLTANLVDAKGQSVSNGVGHRNSTEVHNKSIESWKRDHKKVSAEDQRVLLYSYLKTSMPLVDMAKREEIFIRASDDLNIYLQEVKKPFAKKIAKLKNSGKKDDLYKIYMTIDSLEMVYAQNHFEFMRNADVPAYLTFLNPKPFMFVTPKSLLRMPEVKYNVPLVKAPERVAKAKNNKIQRDNVVIEPQYTKKRTHNFKLGQVVYDVFHRKNKKTKILNKDYVFSLVEQTRKPAFVKTEYDVARYNVLTMRKIGTESGFNPEAHNSTMSEGGTLGLTQIHMGSTRRALENRLGIRYPRRGEKITEDNIARQLLFNAEYDQMRSEELAEKDQARRRRGLRPLLGETVLVKRPVSNGSYAYTPVTLDRISLLSAMQAGPLILDHFCAMLDDHYSRAPQNRRADIPVFDKLYEPHDYNRKYRRAKKQDFNKYLVHAPQKEGDMRYHREIAEKASHRGYHVALASYLKEDQVKRHNQLHVASHAEENKDKKILDAAPKTSAVSNQTVPDTALLKIATHVKENVESPVLQVFRVEKQILSYTITTKEQKPFFKKDVADRRRYFMTVTKDVTSNPLPSAGTQYVYKLVA
jgi:hypothetical protein